MALQVGTPERGYRVPVSKFRSVFVTFKPYTWRCECADWCFNAKAVGYECCHIVAVKRMLTRQEVA